MRSLSRDGGRIVGDPKGSGAITIVTSRSKNRSRPRITVADALAGKVGTPAARTSARGGNEARRSPSHSKSPTPLKSGTGQSSSQSSLGSDWEAISLSGGFCDSAAGSTRLGGGSGEIVVRNGTGFGLRERIIGGVGEGNVESDREESAAATSGESKKSSRRSRWRCEWVWNSNLTQFWLRITRVVLCVRHL